VIVSVRPIAPVIAAWLVITAAAGEARADAGTLAGDAYRLLRYWYGTIWAQDFTNGTEITADLTCDGVADEIYAWRDGVNPEGNYFHVAVVSQPGGSADNGWERLPDVEGGLFPLRLTIGSDDQFALCDSTVTPYGSGYKTTVVPIPADARTRFALPASCRNWLRIDDGMCDALWVGYDPAQQKFILDRN
tara:strand:+ start:7400 stop:7969 length:570 start_codon:yes stop_codon:yes gene_type:complete